MSEDKGMKDKAKGLKDKVVGDAKDKFGKATDDKGKQVEGKAQKAKGEVEDKPATLKRNYPNKLKKRLGFSKPLFFGLIIAKGFE